MPRERFVRRAVRRALDEDDAVTGFISFDGPATVTTLTPEPSVEGVRDTGRALVTEMVTPAMLDDLKVTPSEASIDDWGGVGKRPPHPKRSKR